jgi:hypothetical protein
MIMITVMMIVMMWMMAFHTTHMRCRWVRACDVADESAAEASDPAVTDTKSSTAILEKTSIGAQGSSYTTGDGRGSSKLTFTRSSGSRFWSLACVRIMLNCVTCSGV